MKILIVEDEPQLLAAIAQYLAGEGYACDTAPDYPKALKKILTKDYDCLVVDITLPHGSGLQLIEDIKPLKPETGIIIISARNSLDDKLKALQAGSDDYLTKPFHMPELNSRIQALSRRKNFYADKSIRFREIRADTVSRRAWANDKEVYLTLKEFDLLVYFLSNTNRVISKSAIVEHLWEDQGDNSDTFNFLYTHVKNLRRKFEEKGAPNYIHTVYGIGYKIGLA